MPYILLQDLARVVRLDLDLVKPLLIVRRRLDAREHHRHLEPAIQRDILEERTQITRGLYRGIGRVPGEQKVRLAPRVRI
uniref:Uncharacterized protein n=1 Tax=uncultured marine virus TaxID=186617 RepID=A0A0F7L2B3_9VIRU|nr:hypothetical protein [uncultured marine virus]